MKGINVMKVFARTIAAVFLSCASCQAAFSQEQTAIGYCNDRVDEYSFGFSWDNMPFSTGVLLSADMLEPYVGGKVVAVRIGLFEGEWQEEIDNVKLWIKLDINSDENIYEQAVGTCRPGWNDVALDFPFYINSGSFYIGYDAVQRTAGMAPVSYTRYDTPEAGSLYIDGVDQSELYGGSLSLQCVVEKEGLPDPELSITGMEITDDFLKPGETLKYRLDIANGGRITKDFQVSYQVDDMEPVLKNMTDSIGSTGVCEDEIEVPELAMGIHSLKATITQVEGKDVVLNTFEDSFVVYDKDYPRQHLLEHTTSVDCMVCPMGQNRLEILTEGLDNVEWISYHRNMSPSQIDPYTIDFSSVFSNLMYMTGVPQFSINRTDIMGDNLTAYGCAGDIRVITPVMDKALTYPAFVSIDLKTRYDEATHSLLIEASGERSGYFKMIYDDAMMSVVIVEDSLVCYQKDWDIYVDEYVHNNVVRRIYPESGYGDMIEWTGDNYVYDTSVPLGEDWNLENLRCVVFMHQPVAGQYNSQIMNSASARVMADGGISGSAAGGDMAVTASSEDGRIVLSGDYDSFEVFGLSGMRLENDNLEKGVYVVRVIAGGEVKALKAVVR